MLGSRRRRGEVGNGTQGRRAMKLLVDAGMGRMGRPSFPQLEWWAERCESGRIGLTANELTFHRVRGFKSPPLRQKWR